MDIIQNSTYIKQEFTATEISKTRAHAYTDGPRSLQNLSRWAVIGLSAYMIAETIFVLICSLLIWLYLPSTIIPFTQEQLGAIDMYIISAGILHTLIFWICVILVGRVTFRAMKNLHTIGSKFPEMSPGWAVGWYFIPIANLWKPAQGMSQIYHGSSHAIGAPSPSRWHLPFWWTCWVTANIVGNASVRLGGFDSSDFIITGFSFDAISSLFGILSAWGLIQLIKPIAECQELLKHGGVAQVFD